MHSDAEVLQHSRPYRDVVLPCAVFNIYSYWLSVRFCLFDFVLHSFCLWVQLCFNFLAVSHASDILDVMASGVSCICVYVSVRLAQSLLCPLSNRIHLLQRMLWNPLATKEEKGGGKEA
jgi:hypothetical protein